MRRLCAMWLLVCGWVLWTASSLGTGKPGTPSQWDPSGYESFGACSAAKNTLFNNQTRLKNPKAKMVDSFVSADYISVTWKIPGLDNKDELMFFFLGAKCLPDTVDPRK